MEIEGLIRSVQYNCDISDAQHAGDYTLCIYLLRMREYYRWRHNLDFNQEINKCALTDWLSSTESDWEALEEAEFQAYSIGDESIDPFDSAAVNRALQPHNLYYHAGIGRFGKPVFLFGKLEEQEQYDGYSVIIVGEELARELAAPPAMERDHTIIIRRNALKRLSWELFEEWQWKKPDNAMSQVVKHYDFENDVSDALERMSSDQEETLILHEIGEMLADEILGEDWPEMLLDLSCSSAEIIARAARDNLADCLSVLPALAHNRSWPQLHFYFANMTPMRKALFPSLYGGYRQLQQDQDFTSIKTAIIKGRQHWTQFTRDILTRHQLEGAAAVAGIEQMLESRKL